MIQNWCDTVKQFKEQFTDLQAYLKKQEKSKIKILPLHLKELGRKRTRKLKAKFSSRMDTMIREVKEIKPKSRKCQWN